ncbi:MAG: nucleotidyltransferase domain-containing protein [Janthinobacterium lividum]
MIETSQIQSVADKIARQFQPERIILFGSYAYGTPTEDSDIDLLVVMPFAGRKSQQAITIRTAIRAGFSMDLIPITPERLKHRLEIEDFFLREIVEKGKVLYEADHSRVD